MKKINWQTKKLSEICDIFAGGDVPKGALSQVKTGEFSVPIFSNGEKNRGLYGYTNIARVTHPSITISARGTIGYSEIRMENFYPAIRLVVVTPKDSIIDLYFLKYAIEQIDFNHSGTSIPQLTVPMVKEYLIPLPALPEQLRIVSILNEALEKLDQVKKNIEKNFQNSKDFFESYLQNAFLNPEKDWQEEKLGKLCHFVRGPFGGSLKKSIFVSDGYAVYEQQHAIYDQFNKIRYFIDEWKFAEMKRFELSPDDLIMSCSGTMGRVAIVPNNIKRGIINQALLKLTPNEKILNTFLRSWMESEAFQKALKEYSWGAAIQNVASVKVLKEIKVPLPSIEKQQSIISRLNTLSIETKRLETIYQQKLAHLDELRKSLLQKAFNGEL